MATLPKYVVYGYMTVTYVNHDIWSKRVRFEEIV